MGVIKMDSSWYVEQEGAADFIVRTASLPAVEIAHGEKVYVKVKYARGDLYQVYLVKALMISSGNFGFVPLECFAKCRFHFDGLS
jgi:hypothetical protein